MAFSHFLQSLAGHADHRSLMIAGFVCFVSWTRGAGRTWADRMKISVPLFGADLPQPRPLAVLPHPRHDAAQRHPDPQALDIAKDSTGNRVLSAAIEKAPRT